MCESGGFGNYLSNYYYYHEPSDLDLLSKTCPNLRRVCVNHSFGDDSRISVVAPFHISPAAFSSVLLSRFTQLQELVLVGGAYNAERDSSVLSSLTELKMLELVHVEQVAIGAVANVARACTNLRCLGTVEFEKLIFLTSPRITCAYSRTARAGTAIRRGGHGHSVKFQNSNLQWFF
jgi:hypothetical protein